MITSIGFRGNVSSKEIRDSSVNERQINSRTGIFVDFCIFIFFFAFYERWGGLKLKPKCKKSDVVIGSKENVGSVDVFLNFFATNNTSICRKILFNVFVGLLI